MRRIFDEDPAGRYNRGRKINIIVINNGNSRSNDCWRGRNMH